MAAPSYKAGDLVWVRTGSGSHEEPATVLSAGGNPGKNRRGNASNDSNSGEEQGGEGVLVKYTVSGYEYRIEETEKIRPMDDAPDKSGKGGRARRSRAAHNTSVLMRVDAEATAGGGRATQAKKFRAAAAGCVTPSPAATDASHPDSLIGSSNSSGSDVDAEDSGRAAAAGKRKRPTKKAVASAKRTKKKAMGASDKSGGEDGKGSPYFAKGKAAGGKKSGNEGGTKQPATGKKKATGRTLMLASSEDESEEAMAIETKSAAAKKPAAAKASGKKSAAVAKGKKKPATSNAGAGADDGGKKTKKKKRGFARQEREAPSSADSTASDTAAPAGNQPDGHGGLNQPAPFIVEYSKTGRATCRSCDERIAKGEVRVGHTPLFRGKPGYMVYRHLQCATFSEHILCAEDVENYDALADEDYIRLAEQVEVSKEKLKEEQEELRPDELVQKKFEGEMRGDPPGMAAILLPFQVEGFSWMRHQEVQGEMQGGILADEMGMGKTLQTIATMLDHRPLLQHAKPGQKHPPTADLSERQAEDQLWDRSKADWLKEMDLLKVPKKLRARDGGARAGTLVICPVIALSQWRSEIEKFTDGEALSVCTYHGPDREKETPRQLMQKYDVVLTTYQVLEADFRKMTSPNRVACPNCGGKFKIDKLHIHLKYFCGDNAERTEAQARQQRGSNHRGGRGGGGSRGRRPRNPFGREGGNNDDEEEENGGKKKKKFSVATKAKSAKGKKKPKVDDDEKKPPAKKGPAKKSAKNAAPKRASEEEEENAASSPRAGSKRSAARKAASQISRSAAEWAPPEGDSDSDNFQSDAESSSDDESDGGNESSSEAEYNSDSSSDDSALERAREKQRQALEMSKKGNGKKKAAAKKPPASKGKRKVAAKKSSGKKPTKGKGKKKFDDEDYSSENESSDEGGGGIDDIDMAALMVEAMAGAKNSVLHSLCWWRIVLDEAHFIKSRSSQTANAAFSLIGIHRWCLSGTPLQNRVGEFYSLVRFLRLDPMAFYYCRAKGCDCKSMHYLIHAGVCQGCNHGGIQHYSHFNKYILNPIQRDGYTGDGRRAMFLLKNEVLDKALLRRTKETKAADMELPPRLVQIKAVRLHPIEEDFYSALYTQTKSSFDDYVDSGTLLNNYAHIFDLLIRMRQSVDHPYLVVYSKRGGQMGLTQNGEAPAIANGSADCDLCHEPPTDRVLSTCCGSAYCRSCVLEYMATSNSMSASENGMRCPSCREAFSIDLQASADIEDDASLKVGSKGGSGEGMPSLKELTHVATGSILRRINLADFATSSKIEALTRELVQMRQTSPGSKAIVFSQFVNMLDLIRWRLHSDPYLEHLGLGCRALHGGMNVKARDACLKEFREDNNVRVLLMSLKAGGVALNLTCANHIYLMDPWWNPAAEMQAIDRTHRLGQYRPIRAVRFIAENTVEERILQLQEKKRLVFDGTVGRDAGSLKMLTVDDMKSLFC